jgi:hypothetical protein
LNIDVLINIFSFQNVKISGRKRSKLMKK